jgi:hypothetical protein
MEQLSFLKASFWKSSLADQVLISFNMNSREQERLVWRGQALSPFFEFEKQPEGRWRRLTHF